MSIALDLKNLAPGEHAFHVHQVAKCEPPFATAGPHFNPEAKKHGLENPDGSHAGDMTNITVGADGTAKATIVNKQVTLGAGAELRVRERRDGARHPREAGRHEDRPGRQRRRPDRVRGGREVRDEGWPGSRKPGAESRYLQPGSLKAPIRVEYVAAPFFM